MKTIEEKAKAYDEAIERAKKMTSDLTSLQAIREFIFPELRESEDERIRKELIEIIKTRTEASFFGRKDGLTKASILAYLERQKEPENIHKPIEFKNDELVDIIKGEFEGFRRLLKKKGIDYEPQRGYWEGFARLFDSSAREYVKEQKSALTPERIHPKFAVGDTVCRPMWSDHTIREIYVRCNDPVYVCVNEEGTESHISFSEQDEWERKEQKPAWSEEDKANLDNIIWLCENCEKGIENVWIPSQATQIKNLIKSLRPEPKKASEEENLKIVQYCLEHIRLANWNEEDEEAMTDLCNFINSDFIQEKIHETRRIPWSKALEKNKKNRIKFIPLRPSWKPSEEQMEAFEESLMSVAYTENKIILESLLEQLKKLCQ